MKWFKHMADANRDEKMALVCDELGFEGYGFYWFIIETIASQMDETDKTYVEYPEKIWQRMTGLYPKKLKRLLNVLSNIGVCFANVEGNIIKVDAPNLLKIRDNYTKNLQVTCKQEEEEEEEVEVEVEKYNKKISEVKEINGERKCVQARLVDDSKYVDDKRNKNARSGKISSLKNKARRSTDGITKSQHKDNAHPPTPTPFGIDKSIPQWVDKPLWDEFMNQRQKNKKAIKSDKALDLIISELEKFRNAGHDPNESLKYSIMNGWIGVFEPRAKQKAEWVNKDGDNGKRKSITESARDIFAAIDRGEL